MDNEQAQIPEDVVMIRTLFNRLTEMLTTRIKNPKDAIDSVAMACNWSALVTATIILMLENDTAPKSDVVADRFSVAFNQDVKMQVKKLRELSGKEESRIIVLTREGGR